MINGIEWQFGSGKSSLATHIARKVAIQTSKDVAKKLLASWNVVLSNIPMNTEYFWNYFYFEDDKFLEILRTCNMINDVERVLYWYKKKGSSLTQRKRNRFSKFYIFFDEVWAMMNNKNWKDEAQEIPEYINQNRKNFEEIYIITADWEQSAKTLRRFCEWWYYVTPLFPFWIFKNIWIIRKMQKDSEGKPAMKQYTAKDQNGDYVVKSKPINEYVQWFWKPWVWNLYDDLHKNIRDPKKYTGADKELVIEIIKKKPELRNIFDKNFLPLLEDSDWVAEFPHSVTS